MQQIPSRIVCQNRRSPFRDHGKKVRAARYITAPKIRHRKPRLQKTMLRIVDRFKPIGNST